VELSREVLTDTVAAMIDARAQGDDRAGYKVEVSFGGPGTGANRFNFYVVREGGGHRIRAAGDDVRELGDEALSHAKRGDTKAARRWLDWAKPHVRAGSGQDPLRAPPFIELYAGGKGDPKLAAAALCAPGPCAEDARQLLEPALQKASNDAQRTALEHALAQAHHRLKDEQATIDKARSLRRRHPTSKIAIFLELGALWQAKRFREYRDVVQKALAAKDEESEYSWRSALAEVQQELGQLEQAKASYQTLIDRGKADDSTFNNRAWLSLMIGKVTEEDVGYALQAAQLTQFRGTSSMHTLASLYAEIGKTEEAWQTFLKLLELRPDEQPLSYDWYIVGRIAEHYGMIEDARAAYGRVGPSDGKTASSTQRIAHRRLAALPAAAPP
jgi:tetratricopeptide (TPR) repeat protein